MSEYNSKQKKNLLKKLKAINMTNEKGLHIKRIERDENKLQEMYDLGIQDCKKNLEKLNRYLIK